eukprot:UN10284
MQLLLLLMMKLIIISFNKRTTNSLKFIYMNI